MAESKVIRLRWPARCQSCGACVPKDSKAIWRGAGQVIHVSDCHEPPVTLAHDTGFVTFCSEIGIKPD